MSLALNVPLTVILPLATTVPPVPGSRTTLAVRLKSFVDTFEASAPVTLPVAPTGSSE